MVVFVLHEAVHGLFFWLYTRDRPRFGFKGWYLYASAPGWYLSRNRFLVVGLSPLVTMTAAALGLAMVVPPDGRGRGAGRGRVERGRVARRPVHVRAAARRPASGVVKDRPDGITWHVATT